MELKRSKKSNAANRSAVFCTVLELYIPKIWKKDGFYLKNDAFLYISVSKLNGSNMRSNLLIGLKSSKKSNASNRNGISCAVLEL